MSDVIHLATALAHHPLKERGAVLDLWLDQTRAAAKFTRRMGRPHNLWGDGSLTSRALLSFGAQKRTHHHQGTEFLRVLALVADRLAGVGQTGMKPLY